MIVMAQPLAVGNAVNLILSPPADAARWLLLRRLDPTFGVFSGTPGAGTAVIVDSDLTEVDNGHVVDTASLPNGTPVYYQEADFNGSAWSQSPVVSATPGSIDMEVGPDVLELLRDRLEQSLTAFVVSGSLVSSLGHISVFTAPPVFDQKKFPLVTVHLNTDSPEVRGLGELVSPDIFDSNNSDWVDGEGWLSRVIIDVTGWVLNPDERIALRKAIKAAVIGNLPVFDAAGISLVEIALRDTDDFESYGVPVYMVAGTFSCLAPSIVTGTIPVINDVTAAGSDDQAPTP